MMKLNIVWRTFPSVISVNVNNAPVCQVLKTCIRLKSSKQKLNLPSFKYANQELKVLFGPKINVKKRKTKKGNKTSDTANLGIIGEQFKDLECDDSVFWVEHDKVDSHKNSSNLHSVNTSILNDFSDFQSFKDFKKTQKLTRDSKLPKLVDPSDPLNFVLNCPFVPRSSDQAVQCDLFRSKIDKIGLPYPPSVSSILRKTQSETSLFFLARWQKQMIEELGEEGFKQHQEETLRKGINFHACVQELLSGIQESEIQVQSNIEGHWKSIQHVFKSIEDIKALECSVNHPLLHYKGTFDCLAVYRDTLCVIDWKTSGKPKPLLSNTFDNPVQVAAYLGAINASTNADLEFGPISNAVIVVAYPWGEPAHVHYIDSEKCLYYWSQWLQRLDKYWRSFTTTDTIV